MSSIAPSRTLSRKRNLVSIAVSLHNRINTPAYVRIPGAMFPTGDSDSKQLPPLCF